MFALNRLSNLLAEDSPHLWPWLRILLEIIGLVGLVLIIVFIVLMITMLPDFLRYLKIKSM